MASLTNVSAVFAWGASSFAVALISAAMGLLLTEHAGAVILLQIGYGRKTVKTAYAANAANAASAGKTLNEEHRFLYWCVLIAFPTLAIVAMGYLIAGTILTAVGLNLIAGGSGTMLEWSLLVIGLPVAVLAIGLAPLAKKLLQEEEE